MKNAHKITKGSILYDWYGEPRVVATAGPKYITIEGVKGIKYYADTLTQAPPVYGAGSHLYTTQAEPLERQERTRLNQHITRVINARSNLLTLDQLRQIAAILDPKTQ